MEAPHYLLDSNIISEVIKAEPSFSVIKKLAEHSSDCAISSVTWQEMLFGVERLEEGLRKNELKKFLLEDVKSSFHIIPFDQKAASIQARLRARLAKEGNLPPFADSQILAIAAANNMILATRNLSDFSEAAKACKVQLENWFD